MVSISLLEHALPYHDFLTRYGSSVDRTRWDRTRSAVKLTESQAQLLQSFRRKTHILVLAGAWCGDCASQCPILERFAETASVLNIRYLDNQTHPEVQKSLQINGGNRVPVALFFSEDGHEVARFGERTLTTYRRMVEQVTGEACASGIVGRDELSAITQEWLDQVERVQWILRLSPRLRRLHGD